MKPIIFTYILAIGLAMLIAAPYAAEFAEAAGGFLYVFCIVTIIIGFFGSVGSELDRNRKWMMVTATVAVLVFTVYQHQNFSYAKPAKFIAKHESEILSVIDILKAEENGTYSVELGVTGSIWLLNSKIERRIDLDFDKTAFMRVGSFKIKRIIKEGNNFYLFVKDKTDKAIAYLPDDTKESATIDGNSYEFKYIKGDWYEIHQLGK